MFIFLLKIGSVDISTMLSKKQRFFALRCSKIAAFCLRLANCQQTLTTHLKKIAWQKILFYFLYSTFGLILVTPSFAQKSVDLTQGSKNIALTAPIASQLTAHYRFDQIHFDTTKRLSGTYADKMFYLTLPAQWQINHGKLHLHLAYSPLLLQNASLTVEVNQVPLGSLKLTSQNPKSLIWEIDLPASLFKGKWLNIRLLAFLPSASQNCLDYDKSGNWLYIAPDSQISFDYQPSPFMGDLSQLPYPFISDQILFPNPTLLVLPENLTILQIIPALQVANLLGARADWREMMLNTKTINTLTPTDKSKQNLIFIGHPKDFASLLKSTDLNAFPFLINQVGQLRIKPDQPVSIDSGFMTLTASPWNNEYALLAMTGANENALQKAANALMQSKIIPLQKNYLCIDTDVTTQIKQDTIDWNLVTLKTLGYSDQAVLGLGQNNLTYVFNLPFDKTPVSFFMNAKLSHSPFKYQDHSFVSVLINGVQQASLALVSDTQDKSEWQVSMDETTLLPGKNTLSFVYDLHMPEENCAIANYQAWAVTFADTSLAIQFTGAEKEPLINQFPLPFDIHTLVILPQQLGKLDRTILLNFFMKLGNLMGRPLLAGQILSADQVNVNQLKNQNVILIGELNNNPWITALLRNKKINQETSLVTHLPKQNWSMLQLVNSPWNSQQKVLLITGKDSLAVNFALHVLTDDKQRKNLAGNLVYIDNNQNILLQNTYQNKLTQDNSNNLITVISKHYGLIIFLFFMMLALFAFFVSYWIRHKKQ